MWIASTFNEITAEKIADRFTSGDGQDLQKLVRALVHLELEALGVSRPHDVWQRRVGAGPDGGVDLKYVPAVTTVSAQGTLVPETSGELWFSCKASDGWLGSVLGDLDPRKDANRAEAKRIADHLATSATARFVVVTSKGGDLDAKLGTPTVYLGDTARARIEYCLQQSDTKHAATAFGSKIALVTAVQIEDFLRRTRPGNLPAEWLKELGVRDVKGWEALEEFGKRFTAGGRRSRASFIDDQSREQARTSITRAIESGGILVVCGPPGIGKTRTVYEALNSRTQEPRDNISAVYAPHASMLSDAMATEALDYANVALVVDDVTATELPLLLDALERKKRGKRTSIVLIVSAPEAAVSDKLQSANANAIEVVALERLGERERRQLLSEELASTGSPSIDDAQLDQLANLSHGYPWFAVLLAHQRDTPSTLREAIERAMTGNNQQYDLYWAALLLAVMMRESALNTIDVPQRQFLTASLGVRSWTDLHDAMKRLRERAIVRPHETKDGEQAITYVSPAIFAREVIVRELIEDTAKLRALRECFAQGLERVLVAAEDSELTDDERRTLAENIVRSMDTGAITLDALADPNSPASKLSRQLALAAPSRAASWLAGLVERTTDDQLVARDARMLTVIAALSVAWRRDSRTFDTVEPALRRLAAYDETPFLNNARHQWARLFAEELDPERPIEPRIDRFETVVRSGSTRERILATDVCFAWTANDKYLRAWSSSAENGDVHARNEAQRRVVDCFLLLLSDPSGAVSDAARARLNDVLGARRSTNPWMARVSKQLAAHVVTWSETQRSALLAALAARRSDRGFPPEDPAARAVLEEALRPNTRSERFRAIAQKYRWEPLQNTLDPTLESALDELIAADATEFAAELRWADANDDVQGVRRMVFALGQRDQAGACTERVDRYAREFPGSLVPATYFVGREVGGTSLAAIDETIQRWSDGPMVLARLSYLARSGVHSDLRVEWVTSAARSSAPDFWFEPFLNSAALRHAEPPAQAAIMDAMLDGQSATRAAIVLQLCALRSSRDDSPRLRRAMQALAVARRWPAETHLDWLTALLRVVEEDAAWAADHVMAITEVAAFDVPAPPVDLALREWPEEHSDALWNAVARAYGPNTAAQLSWQLRGVALVEQWVQKVLDWIGSDRQRAVWVTTWLSWLDPKHEWLLGKIAQRWSDDRAMMDELRSWIEAVVTANQGSMTEASRALLDRHIARCAVGDAGWATRIRERLAGSSEPERAA